MLPTPYLRAVAGLGFRLVAARKTRSELAAGSIPPRRKAGDLPLNLTMPPSKYLIVNADDFGRSHSINQAVIRAHRDGVLTTASLMVNGETFDEAVELARQHPKLGIGLHLTLVCGRASLPREKIPGLINEKGEFSNDPIRSGLA